MNSEKTQGYYYQLSLALKADKHRVAVNLEKLQEDLCGARDEFNDLGEGCVLALLKPGMRRLNLLIKAREHLTPDSAAVKLRQFFNILAREYDWSGYSSEDGQLFTIKTFKLTDPHTCRDLLRESRKRNAAFFTQYESKLFFGENILVAGDDPGGQEENPYRRHLDIDEYHDRKPELSLSDACRQLNDLVGLEAAKKEIKLAIRLVEHLHANTKDRPRGPVFPYHYLITADKRGVGMTTLLELLAAIFYHLGIYKRYNFEEHTVREDEHFHFFRRDEDGLMAIHNIDIMEKENPGDFAEITEQIKKINGNTCCVFTITGKSTEVIEQTRQKLEQQLNLRSFHIPDYNSDQLVQIGEKVLARFGMTLDAEARAALKMFFANAAALDDLENARSVKKIGEKLCFAKIEQMIDGASDTAIITAREVEELAAELCFKEIAVSINNDTFTEMDNIIGLQEVKEKILEICQAIALNKKKAELGIVEKRPSLHMLFTGSPGTGKTTMARLVASILRKLEVLSKGGFYELTRDDLVSIYLGGTSNKARNKIREAYGSVLFIDEAYALDGGHDHDYGREALATLVKEMEDKRDDLVVILAGYTEEMKKMLAINPGLKNRIAHQVEFPDYTAPELLQILSKELGSDYNLEEGSREILLELFTEAVRRADHYFGNGRFARTVAERLLAKQALRLGEQDVNSKEVLQAILLEDVKAVTRDRDIAPWCGKSTATKGIGF